MKLRSITFKLMLLVAVVLLVGELFHSIASLRLYNRHLMTRMEMNIESCSDVIRRSIYYGMLANDKDSIRRIIETVGQSPGVTAVRIYNKQGEVMVSSRNQEVGTKVDMAAEACDWCHMPGKSLFVKSDGNYTRIFRQSDGIRQLGISNPIKNEPACSDGNCHAHNPDDRVLGILDVQMSLALVDQNRAKESKQIIFLSGITILLAIGLGSIFLWRTVHAPIGKLIRGTKEIATGNLQHRIEIMTQDELGQLAKSFNIMMATLESAQLDLKQWANTLGEMVTDKTREIEQMQKHIIQAEKITSLGRLSTAVAHELNNPLASILNYSKLSLRELEQLELPIELREKIESDLGFIRDESKRCGDIVNNLLLFARRTGGSFARTRIEDIISRSLMLITHKMEIQSIDLDLRIQNGDDIIICDSAQLQQAFIALLINAIEAMPNGGKLTFEYRTLPDNNHVEFRISDTGVGISEEQLDHIFEPFFTTKADSKGVGMGLSVVYGIIRRHRGNIDIQSNENEGTTCVIQLPRVQSLVEESKS
ncbi:MAG: HAMP domain-containing protein [Fidelibacterota bacterium]|nr:MAG: HAMP domain-containing protein [Candidatus Neomarinimicrobiota bacterium]